MWISFPITLEREGALRMGIALRMSKMQILVLVLFILSVIAIGLVVLHGVVPSIWHALISFRPDVVGRYH
jgi:hypothetical protein